MRIDSSMALIGSLQFGISGSFDCHVYAVRGRRGVVLIDAGGGTHEETLLGNLASDLGAGSIDAIIITHAHPDHCAGAAGLRSRTGARVIVPAISRATIEAGDEESTGLRAAREAGVYPPNLRLSPCAVDQEFSDDAVFEAGGTPFRAIHIRGHSEDSFALLAEIDGKRLLFAGDIVFYGGVLGVINHPGSSMAGYRTDLPKLAGLGIDALLPGHGLFTLKDGQRHIDCAIEQLGHNFLARQIGQGDLIF